MGHLLEKEDSANPSGKWGELVWRMGGGYLWPTGQLTLPERLEKGELWMQWGAAVESLREAERLSKVVKEKGLVSGEVSKSLSFLSMTKLRREESNSRSGKQTLSLFEFHFLCSELIL